MIAAGGLIYFLPTMIAQSREHRQAGAITALNILAGWTAIGWIVSFVWALTSDTRERAEFIATGKHPDGIPRLDDGMLKLARPESEPEIPGPDPGLESDLRYEAFVIGEWRKAYAHVPGDGWPGAIDGRECIVVSFTRRENDSGLHVNVLIDGERKTFVAASHLWQMGADFAIASAATLQAMADRLARMAARAALEPE
jgi:hypothetical protein